MILRIDMVRVRNKILAIKFLRTVGKIGLKEAKELSETIQVSGRQGSDEPVELTGTIRVKVDPVFALTNLLASLNGAANSNYVPVPHGMMVYAETEPKVVDIS